MQQITLNPTPIELGLFRNQYDELVADLAALGYDVEIVRPVEQWDMGRVVTDFGEIYDIAIYVTQAIGGAAALAKLVAVIKKHLRGKTQGRTRKGRIYLPGGKEHIFDLPDE